MASKIELLKKLLAGDKARYKDPNERPTSQTQRRTYDVFQRAASSLYQQSLVGNAERMQRIRDYEEGSPVRQALQVRFIHHMQVIRTAQM